MDLIVLLLISIVALCGFIGFVILKLILIRSIEADKRVLKDLSEGTFFRKK